MGASGDGCVEMLRSKRSCDRTVAGPAGVGHRGPQVESVGLRLITVADGFDIVRPPAVIATRAVVACAVPMFVAAQAATDTSAMDRRLTIPRVLPIPTLWG